MFRVKEMNSMKNPNLSHLLNDWPFDPTRVTARLVVDAEGLEEVQLRLDLGILQMKLSGRPDGELPHGCEHLLAYYRQRVATERRAGFKLDSDACSDLQQECVQYYYRYLALMVLKDYPRVIADTQHSLDIFDLVERHAEYDDLVWEFIQFKPYVLMMNTRAKAEQIAAEGRIDEAVERVEEGIERIEAFLETVEEDPEMTADCPELNMLEDLIQDLRENGSEENPVIALRQKLLHAVHMENFEEAARLRDSIREIEVEHASNPMAARPPS